MDMFDLACRWLGYGVMMIIAFKVGRVLTDAFWFGFKDARNTFRCDLKEGISKWRWFIILPRKFCRSFCQVIAYSFQGIKRAS